MKLHKKGLLLVAGMAVAASFASFAQETEKDATRSYTNDHGNTVTIDKHARIDEAGNVKRSREFEIMNDDGETIAAGKDRDWKDADGRHGSSQAAIKYDADGNRILKRRQAVADGQGNLASRKGKSVRDEDGNLVAKGINGDASKDGIEYRTQKRTRTKADGGTVTKTRRGKIDADGNKTTVKKQKSHPHKRTGGARSPSSRGGKGQRPKRGHRATRI